MRSKGSIGQPAVVEPDPRLTAAYDAGQQRLVHQFASIDEVRSRVGTVLSAAAVATGFLAGQALKTSHGVPAGAWVGIAGAFLLIVDCVAILWPREWAGERLNAMKMIESVRQNPHQSVDEWHVEVAGFAAAHAATNQPKIDRLYQLLSLSLLLLCVDFAGWIWTLAHN